ncbi:MAG: agmatine deiminase family protein, partial [Prevotella sp.]|nr:agmatine deiminase family protein [Prevotella sp.]
MNMKRAVLPAEWEPQSGVMLTWPHAETDWAPYLDEICDTYLQMAEAIARRERLLVVTPHAEETGAMLSERLGKQMMQNVRIVELPTNDTWARDHGFITLRNADGTPLLLDFCFNGWGEKFDARLDNAINKGVIEWLTEERGALSYNCPNNNQTPINAIRSTFNYKTSDVVLEGGSIESDGQGTIYTTTSCLLAPHRNQPLTKEQID